MSEYYPSLIPCFCVHPWFVPERSPNFEYAPSAAIGEIGLDKGSMGKLIDFDLQIEVFKKQLELAKELKRPASVHCVRAFGDLLDIMKETRPFLEGVKKMLKAVPSDRTLIETDAPDAFPKLNLEELFEDDPSLPPELEGVGENPQLRGEE